MEIEKTHLTNEQIEITQNCGTEPPFSGKLLSEKSNQKIYPSRMLNLGIYLLISDSQDFQEKNETEKNKIISDIFEKLNLSIDKAEKDIGIYKSSITKMEQAKELIQELKIKDKN